jgi:hypothetical protein
MEIWDLEIFKKNPETLVALMDLVSQDQVSADVFLALKKDIHRVAWVRMKLKAMGYAPEILEGITIDE